MEAKLSLFRKLLIPIIPGIILLSLYLISLTVAFKSDQYGIISAVSLDLILTLPFIYLLLIWKTKIPKITAIPVGFIGLFIGFQLIPESNQDVLKFALNWIVPVIELTVATVIFLKIRALRSQFKSMGHLDFFDALNEASLQVLPPRIAPLFATEIAVIYYGFINWRSKPLSQNQFTYHKNSGTPALLFALILIIAVEVFAVHLLLMDHSLILAWILSILSIYSGIQLLAFGKSLFYRPYKIADTSLQLNYGILAAADIAYGNISSIEKAAVTIEVNKENKSLSPFGSLENQNVQLHFKKTISYKSLYGIRKKAKSLLIYVDDAEEFIAQVNKRINHT